MLAEMKARLEAERAELVSHSAETAADRKPVELDQQSVGRLSRMDAMQVQAMAQATDARRQARLKRIDAALARIADESYGECLSCGAEIRLKRLEIDPTVPLCVDCSG